MHGKVRLVKFVVEKVGRDVIGVFLSPMVLVLLLLYGGSHESYVSKLVVVSRFGLEEVMVFAMVFGIVFCVVYDHGCDEEMKMVTKLMGEDVVRSVYFLGVFFEVFEVSYIFIVECII